MTDMTIEEIENKHKQLTAKHATLQRDHDRITAELGARKRALREAIEACKKDGFNPDNLEVEIQHAKEVLLTKMNVMDSDLNEIENQLRPMLREIEGG